MEFDWFEKREELEAFFTKNHNIVGFVQKCTDGSYFFVPFSCSFIEPIEKRDGGAGASAPANPHSNQNGGKKT